ncbi:MAG: hypothetical protein V4646_12475 [Pseudomonadota bacterium]
MLTFPIKRLLPGTWFLALVLVGSQAGNAWAQTPSATAAVEQNAAALLDKHAALAAQLAGSPFGRPLFLDSSETADRVNGNAYAVLDSPFSIFSATFKSPKHWCDVMMLHLNTKYCRETADASPSLLNVNIGKKTAQSLADSYALEFAFRLASASPNYLALQLRADKGPLGTSDYRIELKAVPLADGKTFMHLRYSYGYGLPGRLAMQGYLATLGSGKVGFTQTGQEKKPGHIGGVRGIVERNTMRYYLAIEAYMASLGSPPAEQLNARLAHWFDATEQYPLQLHEMDKASYLAMKKSEYQRLQSGS